MFKKLLAGIAIAMSLVFAGGVYADEKSTRMDTHERVIIQNHKNIEILEKEVLKHQKVIAELIAVVNQHKDVIDNLNSNQQKLMEYIRQLVNRILILEDLIEALREDRAAQILQGPVGKHSVNG